MQLEIANTAWESLALKEDDLRTFQFLPSAP